MGLNGKNSGNPFDSILFRWDWLCPKIFVEQYDMDECFGEHIAVEAGDVRGAFTWCAIDIAISLVLLAGLYYWTHVQGSAPARWARL